MPRNCKHLPRRAALLLPLALLLTLCAACGAQEQTPAPAASTQTSAKKYIPPKTLKTDAFTLDLPNGITAQEGEDGALTLYKGEEEIGGVQILPFANAEEFQLNGPLGSQEDSSDLTHLLQLLDPAGEMDYMAETASEQTPVILDLTLWNQHTPETWHRLIAHGDTFYDLFYQTDQVTASEGNTLMLTFKVAE